MAALLGAAGVGAVQGALPGIVRSINPPKRPPKPRITVYTQDEDTPLPKQAQEASIVPPADVFAVPHFLPGLAIALAAGLYGGNKLTSTISSRKAQKEREQQIRTRQDKFDQLMRDTSLNKMASDLLDHVEAECSRKVAGFGVKKTIGTGAGLLGLLAVLSAAGTGIPAYKLFERMDETKALQQAIENQHRRDIAQQAPLAVVQPLPSQVTDHGSASTQSHYLL